MSDDEVSEYIVGRLAELIVVLLRDHVGTDHHDAQIRADAFAILMTLGNWAAKHGRPDLMPQLHGLARKITNTAPSKRPDHGRDAPIGKRGLDGQIVKRVSYRF